MNIRVVVSKNDCDSISDFNVESWYKRVLEDTPEGGSILVATGTMLDRIRLAHVKEEVFIEAIIFEDKIILVDFWAPWCGPCRMLTPIIDRLSEKYPDNVVKVNVDEMRNLASKYGVRGIPSVKIIKGGDVKFKVGSRIPRCSATNINPINYNLDINLPNTLMKVYGHKDLGVYLIPQNSGLIKTNDKVILN